MVIAQLAPVVGGHYAARASDTGFSGATNAVGAYGASVPLDLPPSRGGLPVPLQVLYGGNQVGAAGLGWDVPLSFIYRSKETLAHVRPKPGTFASTTPLPLPEKLSLTLSGSSVDLIRNDTNIGSGATWVAQVGGEQLELIDQGSGVMSLYDGNGLTYTFSAQGATSGSRLDNGNLFLLRDITGTAGATHLTYTFGAPALAGGGTGLSINLANVIYNRSLADTTCFRNKIQLNYDTPSTTPLAMSVFGSTIMARMQKLASISVEAKATCVGSTTSLRRYDFAYQTDPDTQRAQLQKVTMVGQAGTPERSVTLPVAEYTYGAITDNNGNVVYQQTQSIFVTDSSALDPTALGTTATAFDGSLYTGQGFIDLNGDGRLDFHVDGLGVFRNIPSSDARGQTRLTALSDSGLPKPGVESQTISGNSPRFGGWEMPTRSTAPAVAFPMRNAVSTWRQYIDVNGDGRVDFVDASVASDYWLVQLNTPDPTDPSKSVFVPVNISTAPMHLALNIPSQTKIPLASTVTLQTQGAVACFRLFSSGTVGIDFAANCPDLQTAVTNFARSGQTTFTLWELKDINGDGYPDFVYDAGVIPAAQLPAAPSSSGFVQGPPIDLSAPRSVNVLFNSAGVHLAAGGALFEAPVTLEAGGCGLGRWEPASRGVAGGGIVHQTCGFEDVNGDGIPDRVSSTPVVTDGAITDFVSHAALGTGKPDHPYNSGATITLPGPLSRNETPMLSADINLGPAGCVNGSSYDTVRTAILRDINGDGIPDYITNSHYFFNTDTSGGWAVNLGTGTDFSTSRPLSIPAGLDLAKETNKCAFNAIGQPIVSDEAVARTPSGLYDLDGDGQPEIVAMNASTRKLDVYQLKPVVPQLEINAYASNPAAGRLVSIANGYGASTRLSYQSAKDDPFTAHVVPYPEIVVGAELTTDSASPSILRSATVHHAYGKAGLIFDSVHDRFTFPGYGRLVAMQGTAEASPRQGVATITDTNSLAPYIDGSGIDAAARFKRYYTAGSVSDVTELSGTLPTGADPWPLLVVNITNDSRRIAGAHYDADTHFIAAGGVATDGSEACFEMMFPYDFAKSQANALSSVNDECIKRGFVFQKNTFSWRGTPGTADAVTSLATVQTSSSVEAVDDFGRVTQVHDDNDLARTDDDLCTETTYANSTTQTPRVLNAVAQVTTTNCTSSTVLAKKEFIYDGLAVGQVSKGLLTRYSPSRLDENGAVMADTAGGTDFSPATTSFDAVGNPTQVVRQREDGASSTTTVTYDTAFGLVPVSVRVDATNADGSVIPSQTTTITRDAVTLRVRNAANPNGESQSAVFDGFGRLLKSLVTPAGGTEGALSSLTYQGFAVGQTGGLHVVQKVFTDPVDPATVASAAGRVATTSMDTLGRPTRTEVQLGADYGNKIMVAGERTYDLQGRVDFEADPHPIDETNAYGTTYKFNVDGTPLCTIRGRGKQALTQVTDEANELYPTCFNHLYGQHQEDWETRDAASNLTGSRQANIVRRSELSATGQLLKTLTFSGNSSLVPDIKTYGYDALGRRNRLTRIQDTFHGTNPVTTMWHYDSFGQVVELDEPDSAPQFRAYDKWGELTQVQWTDAGTDKRSISQYDALGRLVHSEDKSNESTITATVRDFIYDQAFSNSIPAVTATHVIGRLSKATANTSSVFFSYDGLGQINARVFSDTTVSPAKVYVQQNQLHADGSAQALHLLLPDHGFADERVDYSYDSAARPRAVTYTDGTTTTDLFRANGISDIDVFGRIRHAQFGTATFNATFADTGRRLIQDVMVSTPALHTRRISFAPVAGSGTTAAFDPVGRERVHQEYVDGVTTSDLVTVHGYDAKGRLERVNRFDPATSATQNMSGFEFDPLGNILDSGFTYSSSGIKTGQSAAGGVSLSYRTADGSDRDRIFSIGYGTDTPPTAPNVGYDGVGNIISQATRNSGTRTFSYFPGGQIRQIVQGSSVATYDYDAFGGVQRLELSSTTSADTRHDKHFGGLIAQRTEGGASVITRTIPAPGVTATRHGPTSNWTFAFGETRGTRFVTNAQGVFVQTLDYQPFGEVKNPTGALPGSQDYVQEQWNGGDLLAAFGLNQVGARLYDPVIGRFLSRDPLFDAGNGFNPYAFAANDPINNSDPSGLEVTPPTGLPPGCEPRCGRGPGAGNGISFGEIWHDLSSICIFSCDRAPPDPHTSSTALVSHTPYVRPYGMENPLLKNRNFVSNTLLPENTSSVDLSPKVFLHDPWSDTYSLTADAQATLERQFKNLFGHAPDFSRTTIVGGGRGFYRAATVLNADGTSTITLNEINLGWTSGVDQLGFIAHEYAHAYTGQVYFDNLIGSKTGAEIADKWSRDYSSRNGDYRVPEKWFKNGLYGVPNYFTYRNDAVAELVRYNVLKESVDFGNEYER